ncbi:MAG: hypothetical protein AAGD25_12475 [Cyanobacteria bacterium P01_F01_bin.150]
MHFYPATNGQSSASPHGGYSSQTSHFSSSPNSSTSQPQGPAQKSPGQFTPEFWSDIPSTGSQQPFPENWVDQLQLALAIANPELLQQLVLHCQSPLVAPHQLGAISAAVSVPVAGANAADSVLNVEVIACQLAQQDSSSSQSQASDSSSTRASRPSTPSLNATVQHRALVNQVSRETKLKTLGMNIPLPEAIALLQYATFSLPDIQRILNLSDNGWHRSWWSMVDPMIDQTATSPESGNLGFTIPFKRLIRSRRYADGTVMLQYKDQFAHIPPPCFRTEQKSVLVHIQRQGQKIPEILAWMNHARSSLKTDYGILLYHQLSPLEQQALINQGICLFHCGSAASERASPTSRLVLSEQTTQESIDIDHLANCQICHQKDCPMYGRENSPVLTCRLYERR